MGNLLRVLYNRENDSPNRVDIFVDFESKSAEYYRAVHKGRGGVQGASPSN